MRRPRATRLFGAARTAWAAGQAVRARALAGSARELASDPLLRADIDRLRARIEIYVGSAADAHRIFTVGARAVADLDHGRALEMASAAALTRTFGGDSGATLPDEVLVRPARTSRCRHRPHGLPSPPAGHAHRLGRSATGLARPPPSTRPWRQDGRSRTWTSWATSATQRSTWATTTAPGATTPRWCPPLASSAPAWWSSTAWNGSPSRSSPPRPWTTVRSCADEALTLARSVGQPTLTAAPLAWLALLAALTGSDDYEHHLAEAEKVAAQHPLGILTDPVHDLTRWAKGTRAAAAGDAPAALHHLAALRVPALAADGHRGPHRGGRAGRRPRPGTRLGRRAHPLRGDHQPRVGSGRHPPGARADGRRIRPRPRSRSRARSGTSRRPSRPFDLARARLAYGEFLRRSSRRVDARGHLRSALETFTDLGASPLITRTTQELRASGETARKRDPSTLLDLTPMERKVAQLVGTGMSNKDVAAQCWVSPRTVAFHLRNVFTKLGVSSRTELARLDFG